MKRKIYLLLALITATGTLVLSGCKNTSNSGTEPEADISKNDSVSSVTNETNDTKLFTPKEFTFADVKNYYFEFASGAGGWSEEVQIHADGSFEGVYHDSEMGSTGEGYENGTYYSSAYIGKFGELKKIDDFTYETTVEEIHYDKDINTSEIIDHVLYKYTESYALGSSDTITFMMPGTSTSGLSEVVLNWLPGEYIDSDKGVLTMYTMADLDNYYALYLVPKMLPYEDGKAILRNSSNTFDYYRDLTSSAATTVEAVEYCEIMSCDMDDCLNYLWKIIKETNDEETFNKILEEQRQWLKYRDAELDKLPTTEECGTMATADWYYVNAELTLERCNELVEYIPQNAEWW